MKVTFGQFKEIQGGKWIAAILLMEGHNIIGIMMLNGCQPEQYVEVEELQDYGCFHLTARATR